MTMKILFLGGTGFVGRHMVQHAIDNQTRLGESATGLTGIELVKDVLDWNSADHFSQWQAGLDDVQNRRLEGVRNFVSIL